MEAVFEILKSQGLPGAVILALGAAVVHLYRELGRCREKHAEELKELYKARGEDLDKMSSISKAILGPRADGGQP